MTAPRTPSAPSLRDLLRSSTRAAHAALDGAIAPPGVGWTRERYIAFLQATLAVVGAAEPALAAVLPEFAPGAESSRASRLRADLVSLGATVFAPPAAGFGSFASPAAAYGVAYVIEGSQLGGRVIAATIADSLGLGHEGLTYLRPVGLDARWRRFVAVLDGFGAEASERELRVAVAWASRTFAAFEAAFRGQGLI